MFNNLSRRQILKATGCFFAGTSAAGGVPIITSLTGNPVQAQTSKVILPNLSAWSNLISFRPSEFVQTEVKSRDWNIHRIEDGWGQINLDYYPVTITRLPKFLEKEGTIKPFNLLGFILYNPNNFIDTTIAEFYPYDTKDQNKLDTINRTITLKSTWSDQTAILLNMGVHIEIKKKGFNVEGASVVVSNFTSQSWTFSTIKTPKDSGHPVSGNRQFGYIINPDKSYTFYTRGADRTTSMFDDIISTTVFEGGEKLWQSFQKRLVRVVNEFGGSARVGKSFSKRYDWDAVKAVYYKPKTKWL